jgi:rhodanese-related sulfurtransferase
VFPVSRPIVIDLRRPEDFERGHVHGSYNLHLRNLTYDTAGGDIYGDAGMIHSMSKSLELLLEDEGLRFVLNMTQTSNRIVMVVCYHGDASGLVTAALRARGITAFCIQDGFNGLDAWRSDQSV